MHDITELEGRRIPAVGIATTGFVQAAAAQSQALGFDPVMVFVAHPIQDRTDEEIRELAEVALQEIIRGLRQD